MLKFIKIKLFFPFFNHFSQTLVNVSKVFAFLMLSGILFQTNVPE